MERVKHTPKIYRTLVRIIADNDWDHGDPYAKTRTYPRPVAVLSAWNFRKPVMISSWPPGISKFSDLRGKPEWSKGCWRGYAELDLDAPEDTWCFDVKWVS